MKDVFYLSANYANIMFYLVHMKKITLLFILFSLLLINNSYAQNQDQQEQKSPEEMAAIEAEKMQKDLNLNISQLFFVDSVLQHNYRGLFDEFEKMKSSGMQDSRNYRTVQEKWLDKNLAAFKVILDEQQYISYLKLIGKGKEYKRSKDGKYYKKESKKGKKSKK